LTSQVQDFYDALAPHYHLIYEDWDVAIGRQAHALDALLARHAAGRRPLKILDCACGIGTQAIGLAQLGHRVVASDLSPASVDRASHEARARGVNLDAIVSDMTSLKEIPEHSFDAVIAMDNALPHLEADQLPLACAAIAARIRPGGIFVAGIRDYDALLADKPAAFPPAFYGAEGNRRIYHQVWEWLDLLHYRFHIYLTTQTAGEWQVEHYVSFYRCLLRHEFDTALRAAGFSRTEWLFPPDNGFHQPVVRATLPA